MAVDLKQSWGDASKKVSALKTVNEVKSNEKSLKKRNANSAKEKATNFKKQISDAKKGKKENIKQIKSDLKNQLELLLDLFKESLPKSGGQSLTTIFTTFLEASNNFKEKIQDTLVEEIVTTIGCSEEQSYDTTLNQPIYIKVNQVDLFGQLKDSPDDEVAKVYYEESNSNNGSLPYAMNRQLYKRLQTPNQSFSQDNSSSGGQNYRAKSQSEIFDIEYVQNYTNNNNVLVTGDFYKVTLKPQLNNKTSVSDFLRDYYGSIDILSFDVLGAQLKNALTGCFDFGLGSSEDKAKEESNFLLILKRIMGICSDPQKKIDVSGNAKLSDLDNIDDSFFEPTPQEEMLSERIANNIKKGVVEFEDCGNVQLPINLKSSLTSQQDLVNEKNPSRKIELFNKFINDTSKDPNWQKAAQKFGFKLPNFDLNIKDSLQTSLITQIPVVIFKTLLSPKVMLGFLIMIKGIANEIGKKLDDLYDDLKSFMKTFKKFVVNFLRKITALFVESLFEIVKKNLKQLVEVILTEIIRESKLKQLKMYSTIIYILLTVGQAIVDYRNCKSVIDEILKLLNLGLSAVGAGQGIPPFILASASLLPGISDTRALSGIIENLQSAGLPTGAAPDGGPNLMNVAISSIVQGQNDDFIKNNKSEVFLPPLKVIVPPGGGAGITLPAKGIGKTY
jgi:hypothetical protein